MFNKACQVESSVQPYNNQSKSCSDDRTALQPNALQWLRLGSPRGSPNKTLRLNAPSQSIETFPETHIFPNSPHDHTGITWTISYTYASLDLETESITQL
jgi:hypothetical protein